MYLKLNTVENVSVPVPVTFLVLINGPGHIPSLGCNPRAWLNLLSYIDFQSRLGTLPVPVMLLVPVIIPVLVNVRSRHFLRASPS